MATKRKRVTAKRKSNPTKGAKVPVGKWLKAKVNRNGTITLKVPGKRK